MRQNTARRDKTVPLEFWLLLILKALLESARDFVIVYVAILAYHKGHKRDAQ